MSKVHVCCVVPSDVTWTAHFGNCFTACVTYLLQQPLPGATSQAVSWTNPIGGDLVEQRTLGARQALEKGATHVMWLDSDMIFEPDVVHRLMAHGRPVVAGSHVEATRPCRLDRGGLEPVRHVGMGCMLVVADVFARIEVPWFDRLWNWRVGDAEQDRHHEDVATLPWLTWNGRFEDSWFCGRLTQAGIPIFVDRDVSRHLGRSGGRAFHHTGRNACEPVR